MTKEEQIENLEKMLGETVRLLDKIVYTSSRKTLTINREDYLFHQISDKINSITRRLDSFDKKSNPD